jgi:hypothetical protein
MSREPTEISHGVNPCQIALFLAMPSTPVILTESERGTSEAEWKDPGYASSSMLRQGVLSKLPEQHAAILHATPRHRHVSGQNLNDVVLRSPKIPREYDK